MRLNCECTEIETSFPQSRKERGNTRYASWAPRSFARSPRFAKKTYIFVLKRLNGAKSRGPRAGPLFAVFSVIPSL